MQLNGNVNGNKRQRHPESWRQLMAGEMAMACAGENGWQWLAMAEGNSI
jgi:hypothetical protein